MRRLAVIGAGGWGTALAIAARRAGTSVILWGRDPEIVHWVNERHENPRYLPGIRLDPAIVATSDLCRAVTAEALVLAVPAQAMRALLLRLRELIAHRASLLFCAKGIEIGTLELMSEIGREVFADGRFAVLSGPSFAAEVARDLPTAVVIASADDTFAQGFVTALGSSRFRPYLSTDLVGVELGGAVKNVLAIGCGVVAGRGFGDNARAAIITRGLAEMVRLGLAKGARAETFSGLSGLGDIVLSCTPGQSRNYALGLAIGAGASLEEALSGRHGVIEGVATARAVTAMAASLGVEMPICAAVEAVLHRGASIDATIELLLRRPYRPE